MPARAHVWVSGRVQGVCFRFATRDEAKRQHVTGWVRNLPDGRVETVIEGEEEAVRRMIAFCRQGPPPARVDHVEVQWEESLGEGGEFVIRY
jgi:acylphosphatase